VRLECESAQGMSLLEWGTSWGLAAGRAELRRAREPEVGRTFGPVSALLLADHGYAPVNPRLDRPPAPSGGPAERVSDGDQHGLPSPETLAALEGYALLRTDVNGWIHLSTDGERMWVEVERR
jgi:hypothetical protein